MEVPAQGNHRKVPALGYDAEFLVQGFLQPCCLGWATQSSLLEGTHAEIPIGGVPDAKIS